MQITTICTAATLTPAVSVWGIAKQWHSGTVLTPLWGNTVGLDDL
jgi:hypothetical protein